jgi:membrane peptidoglycan carboxypeptidase
MQVAVLTTEDGAFPRHKGFNHAAIRNSLIANVKSRRFVRGASTITMQLAKNLFLSRDKTLSRKLEEVILADYLEQIFKKDDMMELYLNVIEFGPDVYGITQAADHYFGRRPEELNLAECLFLASIMPSPIRYHRIFEKGEVSEAWMKHIRQLMEIAEKVGNISKTELAEGLSETIAFHKPSDPRPPARAPVGGGGGGRIDREPLEDVGWTPVN